MGSGGREPPHALVCGEGGAALLCRGRGALCRSCDSVARGWSRAVLKLASVSVRVEGVENLALDGAFIVIANHESWFDVWALAGCLPIDARFAAKKELARIPVFGRAWQACGHISVDRANRASAIESMTRAGRQIRGGGPPHGLLRGRDAIS